MGKQITDYQLYRWRYILGYAAIGFAFIGLLIIAGIFAPGGLSLPEMKSVVTSQALSISSFEPHSMINAPYQILQRISLELFGVSNFSIKLPSLLLGAVAGFGILVLLRTWFRRNVAIITAILVVTTGQFLFVAQNGTASIVYIFWSVWLLVAATMVSRQAKLAGLWKIAFFGIAALSLYTPLSIYILLALISAAFLHPHLRYLMKRLSKPKIALASVAALLLLAPLIYAIILQPSLGFTLLGIPTSLPNLQENGLQLLRQYFDFMSPSSGMLMTPVYGLGSMAFIVLGIIRLFTTKYTARSYLISAWIILLLPVLLINPSFTSVTFVPILLLMAMGVNALLSNWYQLFPLNPYARIAGLIPLAVLIGGMVLSGVDRYTYGYLYDPNTAGNFSKDLQLVNKTLAESDRGNTAIVTDPTETAFYAVVAHYQKDVSVLVPKQAPKTAPKTIIYSHAAYKTTQPGITPYRIITDGAAQNGDRFYIYKTNVK
jgi:hypothetical protein